VKEGAFKIGWTKVKVEVLPNRALRCFKCWGKGHIRAACTSEEDRTDCCYRCGSRGHPARECTAPAKYVICAEAGRPAIHRAGDPACRAPMPEKKRLKGESQTPATTTTAAAPPGSGMPMEVVEEASEQPPKDPPGGLKEGGMLAITDGRTKGEAIALPPPSPTPSHEEMEVETESQVRRDPPRQRLPTIKGGRQKERNLRERRG